MHLKSATLAAILLAAPVCAFADEKSDATIVDAAVGLNQGIQQLQTLLKETFKVAGRDRVDLQSLNSPAELGFSDLLLKWITDDRKEKLVEQVKQAIADVRRLNPKDVPTSPDDRVNIADFT